MANALDPVLLKGAIDMWKDLTGTEHQLNLILTEKRRFSLLYLLEVAEAVLELSSDPKPELQADHAGQAIAAPPAAPATELSEASPEALLRPFVPEDAL